jgi:hypothetical protein
MMNGQSTHGHAAVRPGDAKMPPPAPTLDVQLDGANGDLIDDNVIAAVAGLNGIPFNIPPYTNMSEGDLITLLVNGSAAATALVNQGNLGDPLTLTAILSRFEFTGLCTVYYTVLDVHTNNKSPSNPLYLKVVRSQYTNPFKGSYPPPVITPAVYAQAQYNKGTAVTVTISYLTMRPSDTIELHFDLYATTMDKPSDYFYSLANPIPSQPGSTTGIVKFSLPSTQFAGIDENIGYVYYSVYPQPLLEGQSQRAPFEVDVVPPFR